MPRGVKQPDEFPTPVAAVGAVGPRVDADGVVDGHIAPERGRAIVGADAFPRVIRAVVSGPGASTERGIPGGASGHGSADHMASPSVGGGTRGGGMDPGPDLAPSARQDDRICAHGGPSAVDGHGIGVRGILPRCRGPGRHFGPVPTRSPDCGIMAVCWRLWWPSCLADYRMIASSRLWWLVCYVLQLWNDRSLFVTIHSVDSLHRSGKCSRRHADWYGERSFG
jgi:hypothetical protein